MDQNKLFKVSKYDFLLAGIVLALSVAVLVPFKSHAIGRKKALIYKDNKLVKEISLPVTGTQRFDLDGCDIGIEAKGESVRVSRISCPLKICQHEGWISSPDKAIVCVPNKLLIKIVSESENVSCDAVTY